MSEMVSEPQDDVVKFTVQTRMSGATHVARCNGCVATCTMGHEEAAAAAARKAMDAWCFIVRQRSEDWVILRPQRITAEFTNPSAPVVYEVVAERKK